MLPVTLQLHRNKYGMSDTLNQLVAWSTSIAPKVQGSLHPQPLNGDRAGSGTSDVSKQNRTQQMARMRIPSLSSAGNSQAASNGCLQSVSAGEVSHLPGAYAAYSFMSSPARGCHPHWHSKPTGSSFQCGCAGRHRRCLQGALPQQLSPNTK